MADNARDLTAARGHVADAQTVVASNTDTTAVRVFRTMLAPVVFSNVGACHAVSLQVPPQSVLETDRGEGMEVSEFPVPLSLARAVPSRVRSFLAGRHCAARALVLAGCAAPIEPLATGEWGAPRWPGGVVGSITHSARLAAAVVVPAAEARGVGIDAELVMKEDAAEEVVGRVFPEAATLGIRRGNVGPLTWREFVTAVFSAKESIYKCLHPICGVFFDFDAVQLETIDWEGRGMRFRLLQSLGPSIDAAVLLTADFRVEQEHVFTAVKLPSGQSPG